MKSASNGGILKDGLQVIHIQDVYKRQVRMAVERITVVDAETIRIRFRYPGAELEKKL